MITDAQLKKLKETSKKIRIAVLEMLAEAGSGHTAGSLGMADVFTLLYFHILRHKPQNPNWEDRDVVVLSNGHIAPVLYATLAYAGYFEKELLHTLRKLHSPLQGHPHKGALAGVEASSGPLGNGLGQAIGMALANRLKNGPASDRFFYCLLGDGELNEGIIWEGIMLAGREKLGNLIAIVDRNNIQIDGYTHEVMPLEPLKDKFESFNWHVDEVSGHDFVALENAIVEAQATLERPSVIIARTVAGKGVKEFERKPFWHGRPPSKEQLAEAIEELEHNK